MVNAGMKCIKYLLAVFNLAFVVLSIAIIALGATALSRPDEVNKIVETPNKSSISLIVVGVVLFVVAFMGCWGAFRENYCMLITFSVILFIALVIELIAGGLIIGFKKQIEEAAHESFETLMDKARTEEKAKNLVDEAQASLHCCGARGPEDYRRYNMSIPESCCEKEDTRSENPCKDVYQEGCVKIVKNIIIEYYGPVGGVAIAMGIIQLIGLVFACLLARSVKKEYENV